MATTPGQSELDLLIRPGNVYFHWENKTREIAGFVWLVWTKNCETMICLVSLDEKLWNNDLSG